MRGIIERLTGKAWPSPPPTKEERLASWAAKFYLIPLDQRLLEKQK